jgi:hypothetical protein
MRARPHILWNVMKGFGLGLDTEDSATHPSKVREVRVPVGADACCPRMHVSAMKGQASGIHTSHSGRPVVFMVRKYACVRSGWRLGEPCDARP